MKLWIGNTTRKDFLDECRKFRVYGTNYSFKQNYSNMSKDDYLLIKVKVNTKNRNYAYLGPYLIIDQPHSWAKVESRENLWFKLNTFSGPTWLKKFPWCLFLRQAPEYINSLRILREQPNVNSLCIEGEQITKIINDLIQDEYLPRSNKQGYRTNRGVWVKSRAEYMIDNWFSNNNIVTYYEKPIHLGDKMFYPDWYIPSINIYIEFLGMMGNSEYRKKWNYKKKYYDKFKLNYITLIDNDLENLDISLTNKLPEIKK